MLPVIESKKVPVAELNLLAEQLWPGLDGPDLRVSTGVSVDPNWIPIERHGLALWRGRVGMLLPENRAVAAQALTQYSHLRPIRRRIIRRIWGTLIAFGSGAVWDSVALEGRLNSSAVDARTVLHHLNSRVKGSGLSVAMSVRRTANRKALLQVLNDEGRTVGFAKLGWNATSSRGVRTETESLHELDGGTSVFRTPRVLHRGVVNRFPYVLVEALPDDIQRVGIDSQAPPTNEEFAAISPVVRHAPPSGSHHVIRLVERVSVLQESPAVQRDLKDLEILLGLIARVSTWMPIVARWHGDFAFWNVGRTLDGVLWVWDFEDAERDALLGLDVLHWFASRVRRSFGATGLADAAVLHSEAEPALTACGLDERQRSVVHLVYVAEIVTRALEMAAMDGWGSVWATPEQVVHLARSAMR